MFYYIFRRKISILSLNYKKDYVLYLNIIRYNINYIIILLDMFYS